MEVTIPTGYQFANSPIVVRVGVRRDDWPEGATMRTVRITVADSGGDRDYVFGGEVDEEDTFLCDVASAARSVLKAVDVFALYMNDSIPADVLLKRLRRNIEVSVRLRCMLDGKVTDCTPDKVKAFDEFSVVPGGFSEMERYAGMKLDDSPLLDLSTKPQTVESVGVGELYLHPYLGSVTVQGKRILGVYLIKENVTFVHADSLSEHNWSVDLWADTDVTHRRNFLFVNSRGALESASVVTLDEYDLEVNKTIHGSAGMPSYRPTPSLSAHASRRRSVMKMSSGYVTAEWAEWFADEFVPATQHWMRMGDTWMPVTVEAQGTSIQVYDKAKVQAPHVDFTVRLGLHGKVGL